jgi:hypothetical protein
MNAYRFLFSKAAILSFICLSAVFVFVVSNLRYSQETKVVPLFLKVKTSCAEDISKNPKKLVVYVPSKIIAENSIDGFCNNPVVRKQFGQVEVNWGFDLKDAIGFIGKGSADLILTKENLMQAFMAKSTYNYQAVLGYPSYTAFFISLTEKPVLEKAYFLDKRIGLLDYPTSRSGHILPKSLFKQLDLSIESLNIVYANSHSGLRDLLADGKVDVISSYWKEADTERFSENYITPISSNISGSKWYYKMETQNTDLFCALQNVLVEQSQQQISHYYNDAQTYGVCNGTAEE